MIAASVDIKVPPWSDLDARADLFVALISGFYLNVPNTKR